MTDETIEVDYLIVGAGAAGMAFADTLLSETEASIAIVDRQFRPGGHWNDAYPFVRLHQPASYYGVNSRELGCGRIDSRGLNKGFFELASGAEIVSYFDATMRERFLPSGRVQYFPMTSYGTDGTDGTVTSLLSGQQQNARAAKVVDATVSHTTVPSRRLPSFVVAPGMVCAPPNQLPSLAHPGAQYTIVGAGKTAIDACCWLLENGADPETIRWIMPRDSWLYDRKNYQARDRFFLTSLRSLADQVEVLAEAETIEDVYAGLEARGEWRRIDPSVTPTAFHCAIVCDAELAQLRRIRNVVRLGRVTHIEPNRIALDFGEIPTNQDVLHIDCSAPGIPPSHELAIFQPGRITLQWVRMCQPAFSCALIAHLEASRSSDQEKNALCAPVPTPQRPLDWLRMMAIEMHNRYRCSKEVDIVAWMAQSRLDSLSARIDALKPTDVAELAELQRYAKNAGAAVAKLQRFLHGAREG